MERATGQYRVSEWTLRVKEVLRHGFTVKLTAGPYMAFFDTEKGGCYESEMFNGHISVVFCSF